MSRYFVTGATGVVGSEVLARLLKRPDARIFTIVRAPSAAAATERLKTTLAFSGITADDRVRVLAGDAERPAFGLEPTVLEELGQTCTHIIHCAGVVRMNLALADARRAALLPTRNVLSLADLCRRAGRLRKCEFVSTVGVAGRDVRLLEEDWLDTPRSFHNTYEQAKAEAESEVRAGLAAGLPITVHRPSMVVGDSQTGRALRFQVFYHLCDFLSGRRTGGLSPDFGAVRLDVVPVDFVARALLWSSDQDATIGRILHLCSGTEGAIPLPRLQQMVRRVAQEQGLRPPRLRSLPRKLFLGTVTVLGLFADENERRALRTLPVLLDYLESEQGFANSATRGMLAASGVDIPDPNEYLPRVLAYYFERRAIPQRADAR